MTPDHYLIIALCVAVTGCLLLGFMWRAEAQKCEHYRRLRDQWRRKYVRLAHALNVEVRSENECLAEGRKVSQVTVEDRIIHDCN